MDVDPRPVLPELIGNFDDVRAEDEPLRRGPRAYAAIGEMCLCLNLRMASRAITKIYDEALKPSGLRATQLTLLTAIAAMGKATISDLSEALISDRTTLTRHLDVLAHRGLTVSVPGKDRRTRLVTVTPAGRRAIERALPLWEKAQEFVRERLGRRRWEDLFVDISEFVSLTEAK